MANNLGLYVMATPSFQAATAIESSSFYATRRGFVRDSELQLRIREALKTHEQRM
jgi:hypothetical protein